MLTYDELLCRLQDEVRRAGSQLALATELHISPQYLNDILQERREMGPMVLDALGYEKVVMYRAIEVEPEPARNR